MSDDNTQYWGVLRITNPITLEKWKQNGKFAHLINEGYTYAPGCGRFKVGECLCTKCRKLNKTNTTMYNLYKLEHTSIVEEAIKVLEPILKGVHFNKVSTDAMGGIHFFVDDTERLHKIPEIMALARPYTTEGPKAQINFYNNETPVIKVTFNRIVKDHDVSISYWPKSNTTIYL